MNNLKITSKLTFAITGLILSSNVAVAQIPGGLPSSAEPGRVEEQLRLDQQMPELDAGEMANEFVPPEIPASAFDIKFVFKGATLQDSTVISEEDLKGFTAQNMGEEITFDRIYNLADLITQEYRDRGYLMSSVFVPPQEVENGEVRLRAIEGYIDKVNFDFDESVSPKVRAKLERLATGITESRPLNNRDLERQLLLMNDIPGIEARAVIKAAESAPAAADLTIYVTQDDFEGVFSLDNRGTRYIGPLQVQTTISFNDVFGIPGQLSAQVASTANTNEILYGKAIYNKHLGDSGLEMEISGAIGNTEPGHTLSPYEVESDSKTFELMLSYPIKRARAENLEVYGTFTYRDLKTDTLGVNLSEDRIRALRLGLNWDKADTHKGITSANIELSQGLEIIGSSDENDPTSRADAAPDFTKIAATISREQLFDGTSFTLFGAVTGQYSQNSLYAAEEFGVGGESFGSAYDASEITGDSGIAARLEGRYNLYPQKANWITKTQFYAFYDAGLTVDEDPAVGESDNRTLTSAGAGLRLLTDNDYELSLEVAQPIGRRVSSLNNDGNDPRAFFKFTKRF